jgi:hypothetical protein
MILTCSHVQDHWRWIVKSQRFLDVSVSLIQHIFLEPSWLRQTTALKHNYKKNGSAN